MNKFISQVIGARVILYQERTALGSVERVLIDPDDGSLVGLAIKVSDKVSYIPSSEVKGFGKKLIIVESLGSFSEPDEVIKIEKVLGMEPQIIGSVVITESGKKLGKVEDATINLDTTSLEKLYVAQPFFSGALGEQKIINLNQIVSIERKNIVVRDAVVPKKTPILTSEKLPATD